MNMTHLKYYITLVEQASFTKAANELLIAQPSLSMAIKKLETELELKLLDRSKRDLSLTKEGEILYEEAKKLMNHVNYVEGEMKRLKDQGPMELAIGIIESAKFWIPKILKAIKDEYPGVRIEIVEVLGLDDVHKALNNYDIHFAITNQLVSKQEVNVLPIYKENFVALLPTGHPLTKKAKLNVTDLISESFIIFKEGFQTRQDILNAFRQAGSKPNIQFEVERFETAISFVEEGLGVTLVPVNYIKSFQNNRYEVRELNDHNVTRTVFLAHDTRRYLPPLVNRSIELIRGFFEEREDGQP
ncbi:LysR family transcriptional regulator [Planococcus ruber]|uniref:LysR family transcriptional regulator n=1 Tax=Planococcus ruber TaxID=2027871 RepID=UPI001FEE839F|nr:LysR family transcriptional regulator [Planococcus ruber]MCJ1909943.1 LysR family transcriptional regulator [Planococcus ruber]